MEELVLTQGEKIAMVFLIVFLIGTGIVMTWMGGFLFHKIILQG